MDAKSDSRWRGGTQISSRRIRPSSTAASFPAMTSACQFITKRARGLSPWKEVRLNVDSRRSRWPSDFQKVTRS